MDWAGEKFNCVIENIQTLLLPFQHPFFRKPVLVEDAMFDK